MRKAASGRALLMACAAAVALLASAPMPALAQTIDEAALTECLLANTTDEHIAVMRRVVVAGLQDDQEALKAGLSDYGKLIVELAVSSCKVQEAQLSDPAFTAAAGAYGRKLGEKVMTEALARLGQ